jgi:TPR repeat protein
MTNETGGREMLFMMKPEQLEACLRLQQAAERGDGDAACRLGDMYREGLGGLRFSPKQTYRWYAQSALAGDANGQNNLGACYEHGLGCTQSYVKAVKWYRLAAAQGLAYASSNLGYCYWRGHGVGMDLSAALAWFERALEQGDDRAKEMVEKLGSDRSLRVLQIAPSDTGPSASSGDCSAPLTGTQRARPCVLALGSLPRDGLSRRLQPPDPAQSQLRADRPGQHKQSQSAAADVIAIAPAVTTHGDDERSVIAATPAGGERQKPERPAVQVIRGIRFVDETVPGENFGIVGIGRVARPDRDLSESGDTEERQ